MKLSQVPCRGVLRPRPQISSPIDIPITDVQSRDAILNDFISATAIPAHENKDEPFDIDLNVDQNRYSHMDTKYPNIVEDVGEGPAYVPSLQIVQEMAPIVSPAPQSPTTVRPKVVAIPTESVKWQCFRRFLLRMGHGLKILLSCLSCLVLVIVSIPFFRTIPTAPVIALPSEWPKKELDLYALFVQPFFYFISMVSFGIAIALICRRLFRKCVQFGRTYRHQPARPVVIVGVITPSSKRSIAQWVNAHAHPEARRIPEQDLEIHLAQVDESLRKPPELKHYPRALPLPLKDSYVQRIRFEGRTLDSLVLILTSPVLIERSRELTGQGFASGPVWIALAHDIPHASFLLADAVLPPSYVFVQLMYEYKRFL